jgi:hypothetical protein
MFQLHQEFLKCLMGLSVLNKNQLDRVYLRLCTHLGKNFIVTPPIQKIPVIMLGGKYLIFKKCCRHR